jgi:hypothetical protein
MLILKEGILVSKSIWRYRVVYVNGNRVGFSGIRSKKIAQELAKASLFECRVERYDVVRENNEEWLALSYRPKS